MATIADHLLAARVVRPYYARALAALTPVEKPGLGTVAVDDSWRLYYDLEWLNSLPPVQAAHVLAAHEIEHLLRHHSKRRRARDPMGFNVAGDMEINDDLDAKLLPAGCLRPAMLKGAKDGDMAEIYYDLLPKNPPQNKACGSGAGNPIDGELPNTPGAGVSEDQAEVIRRQVATDVKAHAASKPGSVPAGVLVWADTILKEPDVDWRRELAAVVARACRATKLGREDYSFRKPSYRVAGVIMPGMIQYVPKIAVVADTSGSMGGYGAEVLGHVHAITRSAGLVSVVACDVEAHKVKRGQFKGGGGTDLRVGIKAAEKDKPDLIVVLTDAETPWPDTAPAARTIIVDVTGAAHDYPGWATVIKTGGAKKRAKV